MLDGSLRNRVCADAFKVSVMHDLNLQLEFEVSLVDQNVVFSSILGLAGGVVNWNLLLSSLICWPLNLNISLELPL